VGASARRLRRRLVVVREAGGSRKRARYVRIQKAGDTKGLVADWEFVEEWERQRGD